MKGFKTLIAVSLLSLAGVFIYNLPINEKNNEGVVESTSVVLGVPTQQEGIEIKIDERTFEAQFVVVDNAADILLLPNFEEKQTSQELLERAGCRVLFNGGYYTPEGYPTGLFVTESKQLKKYINSSLSNAVYSINDFETPRITRLVPQDSLRVALQNGPLLIENDTPIKLGSKSIEEDRRVVVGITGNNETVFVVIYDTTSVFLGPRLEDLPRALEIFEDTSEVDLADAMNLDGGTASAFISQDLALRELSHIGSYFCIK